MSRRRQMQPSDWIELCLLYQAGQGIASYAEQPQIEFTWRKDASAKG